MAQDIALHRLLERSAQRFPDRIAVEESGTGQISYGQLDALASDVRDRLCWMGVRPGDRVGICLHKSISTVATLFGILKTGAAYVPVDVDAPAARNAFILNDCSVRVAVVEQSVELPLHAELRKYGLLPQLLVVESVADVDGLGKVLAKAQAADPAPAVASAAPAPDDLAYILYTSGSTGKPKGVMISHRAAATFVDWCSETFQPTDNDRFSSHAPFHFDLSIHDIYVPIKHGATLVLIGEEIGKDPVRLAQLAADKRISFWYSTPSILSLMAQYGQLEEHDYTSLRIVLFAGEVFPVKHLRLLKSLIPHPVYYNLYGPTETNVCTYYQIPREVPEARSQPYPIGKACAHYRAIVVDEAGADVLVGAEGELCISGPGVMQSYWNLLDRTSAAFLPDRRDGRWYRTGDIVVEAEDGNYVFIGRRDRMVKKRGYRVELGEIETALYQHPAVKEAAVVALSDENQGVRIKAFVTGRTGERLSIIKMKQFCMERLPGYMVPDLFSFHEVLPKTSTDKIDYQTLKELG